MAWVAVVGVLLCVAVMLVCFSVLTGFVDKIEAAAKGLFGDIVVESVSLSGLGRYDEFIAELKKVPEVEAASPFIITYGIVRVPNTDYRQTVQVAGIRLPERTRVSDFGKGLFVQGGLAAPTFDPPVDLVLKKLNADKKEIMQTMGPDNPRYFTAVVYHNQSIGRFTHAGTLDEQAINLQNELDKALSDGQDVDYIKKLKDHLASTNMERILPPDKRIILGLGIPGLCIKTTTGQVVRYITPGQQLVLMLLPLGRGSMSGDITPANVSFTVIDDNRSGVYSIDSNMVYVPFETLQQLNDMGEETTVTGDKLPARCSAIHIKIRGSGPGDEARLVPVRRKIEELWTNFCLAHPGAARSEVSIKTWRERQESIISSIGSQRTIMVIILGVISIVAVLMVFVLFYTIVMQKTKDIGVIKAVGGSSWGVAQIFLAYGLAVGLVGSLLGTAVGYYFVLRINDVHDWLGRAFGFQVWSKETFWFDTIPNSVPLLPAVLIVVASMAAGMIGALIPALKAARMQPVEALRYE